VKRWEFIPLEAGHKVRKAEILFRKVSDEDIIAYVLSYIGKGNPESARILLDKYYKMEDVIKIAKERLGDESEIILRRIYGEKVKITPKREKKEGSKVSYVKFEEFAKLDIRIGKIISVEDHPNADKLYLIKVDLGDEVRQLVAGLKKYYKKEELLNRYVAVITNLEPKKLRGIESQGMILAADDGKNVALLTPEKEVKLGAKVR